MEAETFNLSEGELSIKEELREEFTAFWKSVNQHLQNEGVYGARFEKFSELIHLKCVFYSCVNDGKPAESKGKPLEMWKAWYEWRKKYEKMGISPETIKSEINTGKAFWHKSDKLGHPCLIVKVRRNIAGSCPIFERMRFMIYMLDQGKKK